MIEKRVENIKEFQLTANMLGLRYNAFGIYDAFKQHEVDKNGSLRYEKNNYFEKLEQRDDRIFCRMNELLESMVKFYKKDNQQVYIINNKQ